MNNDKRIIYSMISIIVLAMASNKCLKLSQAFASLNTLNILTERKALKGPKLLDLLLSWLIIKSIIDIITIKPSKQLKGTEK